MWQILFFCHAILKALSLISRWNFESQLAKILKSLRDTMWLANSILSLTAVVVSDFDFFQVKDEMPECSPTLPFKCCHNR